MLTIIKIIQKLFEEKMIFSFFFFIGTHSQSLRIRCVFATLTKKEKKNTSLFKTEYVNLEKALQSKIKSYSEV